MTTDTIAVAAPAAPPRAVPRPSTRRLAILVLAGAVPVVLGRVVLLLTPLERHPTQEFDAQFPQIPLAALWIATMLIAYRRAPDRPLWKLILLFLWTDQIWTLWFIPHSLTWTISELLLELNDVVSVHLLVAFPTGLLATRFDRRLVGFLYVFVLGVNLAGHLVWLPPWVGPDCTGYCPENLLLAWPSADLFAIIDRVSTLAVPFLGVAVLVAIGRHWRAASAAARRALLPVAVAAPLWIVLTVAWYVARNNGWVAATEILGSNTFLFVDYILPVGVLLGVLRARMHRSVVADLAAHLGQGLAIGGLGPALARALHDPSLEVAFPSPDGEGLVDPDGRPFALPMPGSPRAVTRLERDGELLAVLVYDPAVTAEDPELVDAVGSVARLALANERLAAQVRAQLEEVRASRARIVEAADDERRRVERDLHDGAQQRLVALAMRLQLAKETTEGSQALLDEATAELRAAISEVRDLARGLHPPILTERGLAAAVEALAERTPIPVVIDIPEMRFPTPIEAAAYFVIAESLTNVVRYAGATEARVSAVVSGDRVVIRVEDDGRGGADPAAGSGLRGLADRVAAVRGLLSVESPLGRGTAVRAELPLA